MRSVVLLDLQRILWGNDLARFNKILSLIKFADSTVPSISQKYTRTYANSTVLHFTSNLQLL